MAKAKRARLPLLKWREIERTKAGCREWKTLDGTFKLTCQDQYYGIRLSTLWILWQFKRGEYQKVEERRGRDAIEKCARQRQSQLDATENDE